MLEIQAQEGGTLVSDLSKQLGYVRDLRYKSQLKHSSATEFLNEEINRLR